MCYTREKLRKGVRFVQEDLLAHGLVVLLCPPPLWSHSVPRAAHFQAASDPSPTRANTAETFPTMPDDMRERAMYSHGLSAMTPTKNRRSHVMTSLYNTSNGSPVKVSHAKEEV